MSTSGPEADGPASAGLKQFVRETLGCTCPDEVFDRVDLRDGPPLSDGGHVRRIAIGGRLLVYLIEGVSLDEASREIGRWAVSGRADRDGSDMNRFRLVIRLDDISDPEAGRLADVFAAAREQDDDRMHLHLVGSAALGPVDIL
jgi:hypothetical protein